MTVTACLLGVTSFFTIAVGGVAVGMLVGLVTALITKHTKEVRVVEPLVMMIMAYLAYMVAELLHWSGILSLVGCGIVQSHYAFKADWSTLIGPGPGPSRLCSDWLKSIPSLFCHKDTAKLGHFLPFAAVSLLHKGGFQASKKSIMERPYAVKRK